jgi:sugar phosphate isomerase/epimerase
MNVRRGFATVPGAEMDYGVAIPRAAEWDLDFVELTMEGRHRRQRVREEAAEIGACAEANGVSLAVHLPLRLDLGSPYERVQEATLREAEDALESATVVDATRAVVHPRTDAYRPAYDDDVLRERLFEALLDLDSYAAHCGVELCVENLTDGLFRLDREFAELFSEGVSACLDTGHAHVAGFDAADQAALLTERGDRIAHVHLNDTRRADTDEHLPFGAGDVEFERLFAAMAETDWSGTVSLEVWTDSWEYLQTSAERLTETLAAVEE